jgi:hypothetical protein
VLLQTLIYNFEIRPQDRIDKGGLDLPGNDRYEGTNKEGSLLLQCAKDQLEDERGHKAALGKMEKEGVVQLALSILRSESSLAVLLYQVFDDGTAVCEVSD